MQAEATRGIKPSLAPSMGSTRLDTSAPSFTRYPPCLLVVIKVVFWHPLPAFSQQAADFHRPWQSLVSSRHRQAPSPQHVVSAESSSHRHHAFGLVCCTSGLSRWMLVCTLNAQLPACGG